MGEVYRARDTRLNRTVAIKVLPAEFASDPDRLRRFQSEAQILSALNHPGLLVIYDVGAEGHIRFLVSEYLDGRTLREAIPAGGLPPRRVADYARQIASALAAAHERGIVHRDIKPENIFVTRDEHVKILDFGLAKDIAPTSSEASTLAVVDATAAGMVLGTAGYMAPEQVRGEPVDHRADIFSTGAVIYEMLTGKRAFSGASPVETMNAILKDDPPDLDALAPRAGTGFSAVVKRCLDKSPRRRFQSASDLAFAVEALAGASSTAAGAARAPASRPGRGWIVAAVTTTLLLAAAAALLWRARPAPAPSVTYTRLTLQSTTVFNGRFAPDGTVLYSAAQGGNVPSLFARRRDASEARKIDLAGGAALLSVSSKGEVALLARPKFIRHRWFRGTLARMSIEGTAPREVLDDVEDADWSPDGGELAVIHQVDNEERIEFPIGTVRYRTTGRLTDLRVSPRGDRLAFMEHPAGVDDRGTVAVVDLQGRKSVLTPVFAGEEGLAWAPDGREILFAAAADEPLPRLTIQAATLDGGHRTVLEAVDYLTVYDVSANGDLLVVEGEEHYQTLSRAPGAPEERDVSWLDQSGFVRMTGDGAHVLFTEFTFSPNYAIGYRRTDGSPVVRIGDGMALDVSKDGTLALGAVPTTPMQLMVYPTGAGQPRALDGGAITDFTSGKFFRDKLRALACGREADRPGRCYVTALAGGPPAPITPEGTSRGVLSPDGSSVVAWSDDGTYSIYPIGGGPSRRLDTLTPDDDVVDWTADGRALVVLAPAQIPTPVDRLDLASGKRVRMFDLAPADRAGVVFVMNASVADDGRAYAYSVIRLQNRLAIVHGSQR
jgi:hypothetical protein